jgi:multicomponent Na+:H+ antiporter subunit D
LDLILSLTVVVPLGSAAVLGGANTRIPGPLRVVLALGAAATVTVLSLILLANSGTHPLVLWFGGWRPEGNVVIGVDYAVDPVGAALAALAGLLAFVALLYSTRFFGAVGGRYPALVLVFTAASVDFSFSGDLFNMFVAFELVAVTGFVLSGFYAEDEAPLQGAINFAVTNTIGGLTVLAGLLFLYKHTGTLNLARMGVVLAGHRPDGLVVVAFALLATGFLTKAAVVPFHFWLPDAYGTAPAPTCVLLAGVMSELGLFGLARVWETVFSGAVGPVGEHRIRILLCAMGVTTALVGALMALAQKRLRRLLGFVTVAHMGLYLLGFGLLRTSALGGIVLLAAGDGLVKAALFLAAGVVQRHRRSRQAQTRTVPIALAAAALAVGALALADLPPFTSSVGKDLLVDAAGSSGWWVETVIALTVIFSSAAIVRAAVLSWTATGGGYGQDSPGEEGEAADSALSGSRLGVANLIAPPMALLAVALGIGLVPHLDQRAVTAAAAFSNRSSYAAAVLQGKTTPVAVPAAPAASTGATITDLLEAAGAVAIGAVLVARQRRLLRLRAVTGRAVLWLRHLHTGHVGDQLTWQLAGAVALAGLGGLALR